MTSSSPSISAIVPIKLNSRRLPNKNFLLLGEKPLCRYIFETLSDIPIINDTFCYTSQAQVLSFLPNSVQLLPRQPRLDGDNIEANELFLDAISRIESDIILICHATSPFVEKKSIVSALNILLSGEYDSVFSARSFKSYAWYQDKPLNYNPFSMRQTQSLDPVYIETSGFYMFWKKDYMQTNSRIGSNPYMYILDEREAIDIDYPEDFALAKRLLEPLIFAASDSRSEIFINHAKNLALDVASILHVSFDLDGVLIDSIRLMEMAWTYAMKQSGLSVGFDSYKSKIGLPFSDILEALDIPLDKRADITQCYEDFSKNNQQEVVIYADATESLKVLMSMNVKLTIVTSKSKDRAIPLIRSLFPDIEFCGIICPEDLPPGRGKPCPDPLLMACLLAGVDPSSSVYIGDMSSDLETASRAGVPFVFADWGYSDKNQKRTNWFASLHDFTSYISSIKY